MNTRLLNRIPLISNRTKISISLLLLIYSFILYVFSPECFDRKLCMLAMLFSFIGDVLLNCRPLDKRSHTLLYIGAIFFMISHLIYATAYYFLISNSNQTFINTGAYLAYYFMATILIGSITYILLTKKHVKPIMIFVFLIYTAIISINFIVICSYSWSTHAVSFIGAISFLISDYIIGVENVFKIKSNTLRKLVWIFYPVGQFLILTCR